MKNNNTGDGLESVELIHLSTEGGARATMSLFGGHLLSWRPLPNHSEQLYLSDNAVMNASAPIRGGVPVLFPKFGVQETMPNHGFARIMNWRVKEQLSHEWGESVELCLSDTPVTRTYWPHEFRVSLIIELRDASVAMLYRVENSGLDELRFRGGLHTYLATENVESTRLVGLQGCDFVESRAMGTEDSPYLTFDKAIDRLYFHPTAANELRLISPGRRLSIRSTGFEETMVWNPWSHGESELSDMSVGDYARMLCVESVIASKDVRVPAGSEWLGSQRLTLLDS